jgi:hypothetical protein
MVNYISNLLLRIGSTQPNINIYGADKVYQIITAKVTHDDVKNAEMKEKIGSLTSARKDASAR